MRHDTLTLPTAMILAATSGLAGADVLLIPDSGNDKVWAFDPFDGSVLTEDFIPSDGNLIQPINAIDSQDGTILVSDENADAVFEYAYDGSFLRTVADNLDALQGITVVEGTAFVASRTGPAIYRIRIDNGDVSLFSDAAELGTPRDLAIGGSVLVTNSGGENIERLDLDGVFVETFHDSDGATGIDFPQQLQVFDSGQVLVAGFSAPFGLYLYDADGNEEAAFTNLITSPRGVYPLGNGQYLYSGGTRVMRYDPVTMTEETVINRSGTSFRYIEFSRAPFVPSDTDDDGVADNADNCIEVANADQRDTNEDGIGNACDADIDGDCAVNFGDLANLKAAFTPRPYNPDADFDGDGSVNFGDLAVMKATFFNGPNPGPGPSGAPNACD